MRSLLFSEEHTMLKQPITGFARRVDDTVTRAMTILQHKQDHTNKPEGRSLPNRQKP
jgi:hypothetical protein